MQHSDYPTVDVPFEFRHICWFCGEPARRNLRFPVNAFLLLDCPHTPFTLPACDECILIVKSGECVDISACKHFVKKQLIKRYKKHLAIGVNWTKEELENAELEGKAFDGFKKSGWMMYEIAQGRVNFNGWPLVVDEDNIDMESTTTEFWFDGTNFPSLLAAVTHYSDVFYLDPDFLQSLVLALGTENFGRAVSLARTNITLSSAEKRAFVSGLKQAN